MNTYRDLRPRTPGPCWGRKDGTHADRWPVPGRSPPAISRRQRSACTRCVPEAEIETRERMYRCVQSVSLVASIEINTARHICNAVPNRPSNRPHLLCIDTGIPNIAVRRICKCKALVAIRRRNIQKYRDSAYTQPYGYNRLDALYASVAHCRMRLCRSVSRPQENVYQPPAIP